MRLLLLGANGFVGRQLQTLLRSRGHDVFAVSRAAASDDPNVVALGENWTIPLLVRALVAARPEIVFHLVGKTTGSSLAENLDVNAGITARLFDALDDIKSDARVIVAGSAAEYGFVEPEDLPVAETYPCAPIGAYGASKLAQTVLAMCRAQQGKPAMVARISNPVGPGMPAHLSLSSFARRIAALPDSGGVLRVGNLGVRRDFIAVEEVARLLYELAVRPKAFGQVINICAGRSYELRALVEAMIAASGRAIEISPDPALMRGRDMPDFYGSLERLRQLGLEPAAPDFGAIIPAILNDAMQRHE